MDNVDCLFGKKSIFTVFSFSKTLIIKVLNA